MFRPKLLFTSLAALALGACSPQDPQAVTSAAIAKQVILPTYSRWVEADRQLAVSALAYCQGKESLETARADFLHAQKAWAELQPLLIGPLAEGNRSWQVQFWPDKKNLVGRQVEQLVTAQPQIDGAVFQFQVAVGVSRVGGHPDIAALGQRISGVTRSNRQPPRKKPSSCPWILSPRPSTTSSAPAATPSST